MFRVLFLAAIVIGVGNWAKSEAMAKPKASASDSCKMTYSRPQYVPLPVAGYPVQGEGGEGGNAEDVPGYGYRLLRYMDGKLPANERAEPLEPGGIPVLFVPGHMGSYKQVWLRTASMIVHHAGDTHNGFGLSGVLLVVLSVGDELHYTSG